MTTRNPLPHDFYASAGLDETWALVRSQVLAALEEENSSGDNTLDKMLLERTSMMYAQLRQLEASNGAPVSNLLGPAQYKDFSRMLVQMIESLRAQRDKDFIIEEARAEVMHAMINALKEALEPLPPAQRKEIMSHLQVLMAG